MRRPAVLLAIAAVAATAFAPATTSTASYELVTDDDPSTRQPVVLLLGADADPAAAYDQQLVADRFAFAAADLGCGDLGGPDDVATVANLVAAISSNDTTTATVALRGSGVAGLQVLSAAASGVEGVAAVVTEDAITDPHDILFSEGGVARQSDGGLTTPSLPCDHVGSTDGTRDAWWAERDMSTRLAGATAGVMITHDVDSQVPTRQAHLVLDQLSDERGDAFLVNSSGEGNQGPIEMFLAAHLLDDDRTLFVYDDGATYTTNCVLRLCGGGTGTYRNGTHLPPVVEPTTLHLNRTFEQDYDCVPVCVPGPGTGEIGMLDPVNRFETPYAPVFTWADAGANSETVTARDPLNEGSGLDGRDELPGGHGYHSLAFQTMRVEDSAHLRGTPVLEGWFNTGSAGGTITPLLVVMQDIGSDSTLQESIGVIARGALDLDLAADRSTRQHVAGWKQARIVFDHVDVHLWEGDRLGLILQSSNVDHFAPGTPQGLVNVATGPVDGVTTVGSVLHLPIARGEFATRGE